MNLPRPLLLFAALALAPPLHAAEVPWTGTVSTVVFDDGQGDFTGSGVGSLFSGTFSYPDTCVPGPCVTFDQPPDEADYAFPNASWSATNIGAPSPFTAMGTLVSINIQDNHPLDADEVILVNSILGAGTVVVGQLVDVWTAAGESADETFDVEIILASLTPDLFDGRGFQPTPPSLAEVDLAIFTVEQELDPFGEGDPNYEVLGMLTSVPEPATTALLIMGLAGGVLRRLYPR